ncbi:MAG TPA: hypothetical protein VN912_07005 [Candidatus Angelobacter sp.]|nr:hypothetical protein [Candidatus Angelobacter sp.]
MQGTGILIVLALVALDVVLGVMTGWLAFQPTSQLDERQAALRDRAYRIGFRLVGAGVLLLFALYVIGSILSAIVLGPQSQSPSDGFNPRTVVAILELLAIAPTVVIAWLLRSDSEAVNGPATRWIPLMAVPIVALAWIVAVLVAPVETTVLATVPDTSFAMGAAKCGHFGAVKRVASGFGGAIRLEAEVCWNGKQAFTYGDPSLPRPSSLPAEEFAMAFPGLTSCAPLPTDTDFGNVVEHCTGQIDADGTLHVGLRGRVSPLPGDFGARDVQLRLIVTRDGKVVAFD